MATHAIGTIIGRKTVSKGRTYVKVGIYCPTKLSEDSAFPFKIGDPCVLDLDPKTKTLTAKPISQKEAKERGWTRRNRFAR